MWYTINEINNRLLQLTSWLTEPLVRQERCRCPTRFADSPAGWNHGSVPNVCEIEDIHVYTRERRVSPASAASSSALCATRRGKFIYSRRSIFNPDARLDARLRETPDPRTSSPAMHFVVVYLRVCTYVYTWRLYVYACVVRTNSNNIRAGYIVKQQLISCRVLVFDRLGFDISFRFDRRND